MQTPFDANITPNPTSDAQRRPPHLFSQRPLSGPNVDRCSPSQTNDSTRFEWTPSKSPIPPTGAHPDTTPYPDRRTFLYASPMKTATKHITTAKREKGLRSNDGGQTQRLNSINGADPFRKTRFSLEDSIAEKEASSYGKLPKNESHQTPQAEEPGGPATALKTTERSLELVMSARRALPRTLAPPTYSTSTSTSSPSTLTGNTCSPCGAGPMTTSPVMTSNIAPCSAHITSLPSRYP